jgi:hypothetical protein
MYWPSCLLQLSVLYITRSCCLDAFFYQVIAGCQVLRGSYLPWLSYNDMEISVEELYCKRPIQCLASSEILTPHPLTARRVCTRPPLVRGEDTLARGRGGGVDTALYSIYVSTLWRYLSCTHNITIFQHTHTYTVYRKYIPASAPPHATFSLMMQTQSQILIIWFSSTDDYTLCLCLFFRNGVGGGVVGDEWVHFSQYRVRRN